MTDSRPIRVGIMGFGQTGRQIYELASRSEDVEVVAVADIGKPEILHYLLCSEVGEPQRHQLQDNFLVNPRFRARLMQIDRPAEMPWDIFDVDMVIDSTGKYGESHYLEDHLGNGAPRVLLRTLPVDTIDRIVIPGISDGEINSSDRMISAGSATTTVRIALTAAALAAIAVTATAVTTTAAATFAAAIQHHQCCVKTLQHHFGGIAILPTLILPFACLQLALKIDLGTLAQVLFGYPHQTFAKDSHRMPFGFLAPLAGVAIFPGLGRGYAQIAHLAAVLKAAHLGVASQVPDKNDFVD